MHLESISYVEYRSNPQQWQLDELRLNKKNLIVGRNATGKSRALNLIGALATTLAGLRKAGLSGEYDCLFRHEGKSIRYKLHCENEEVISEVFNVDGRDLLVRKEGGVGQIYAEKLADGQMLDFQTPTKDIAAVSRRDSIQHSFLEPLYEWASSLRHYRFGTSLGQDHLAVFVQGGAKVDERNPNSVVALYRSATKKFGDEFKAAVIQDLKTLDYHIDDLSIATPISVRLESGPGELQGLQVKERDLAGVTDHLSMSMGMFRVLSLIIQLNYCQFAKKHSCFLIDDVGEGLDFERSCSLIDLIRNKADKLDVQIIMATNDRFVMNKVPLEEWSVLSRKGARVHVNNFDNSKELFEEFKFTGLSNFSFFELDVAGTKH